MKGSPSEYADLIPQHSPPPNTDGALLLCRCLVWTGFGGQKPKYIDNKKQRHNISSLNLKFF